MSLPWTEDANPSFTATTTKLYLSLLMANLRQGFRLRRKSRSVDLTTTFLTPIIETRGKKCSRFDAKFASSLQKISVISGGCCRNEKMRRKLLMKVSIQFVNNNFSFKQSFETLQNHFTCFANSKTIKFYLTHELAALPVSLMLLFGLILNAANDCPILNPVALNY